MAARQAAGEARFAALEAQIQALQAQLQGQAQQPLVVPGPFALTPAQAQHDVIDLSSSTGIKLYKQIVSPLTVPFDGSPKKLVTFLSSVSDKATTSGWGALLTVNNQALVNPEDRNLISQHRMLTIENVRAKAMTYVGQQTRMAQDARWMFEFLKDSLTESARMRVMLQPDHYRINGIDDGPCFLKMILLTFYVETNATNFLLRKKLIDLPEKMISLKSHVPDFNVYVREILTDLSSGGRTADDLLVYLFDSYKVVTDHAFHRWYERKKEDYDDGREEITPKALMLAAETKFNQLTQEENWARKSKEEEMILALKAQVAELTKNKASTNNKASTKQASKEKITVKQDNKKSSDNNKSKDNQGTLRERYPEWRFKRNGNQKTHTVDGKTYHWCDPLNMWALHEPKDCKIGKNKKEQSKSKSKGSEPSALSIAKALVAVSSADTCETNDDASV